MSGPWRSAAAKTTLHGYREKTERQRDAQERGRWIPGQGSRPLPPLVCRPQGGCVTVLRAHAAGSRDQWETWGTMDRDRGRDSAITLLCHREQAPCPSAPRGPPTENLHTHPQGPRSSPGQALRVATAASPESLPGTLQSEGARFCSLLRPLSSGRRGAHSGWGRLSTHSQGAPGEVERSEGPHIMKTQVRDGARPEGTQGDELPA